MIKINKKAKNQIKNNQRKKKENKVNIYQLTLHATNNNIFIANSLFQLRATIIYFIMFIILHCCSYYYVFDLDMLINMRQCCGHWKN